jgi:hypothetical protein
VTRVPAGRECLDGAETGCLSDLTQELLAGRPEALQEYRRFLAIGLPGADLDGRGCERGLIITRQGRARSSVRDRGPAPS